MTGVELVIGIICLLRVAGVRLLSLVTYPLCQVLICVLVCLKLCVRSWSVLLRLLHHAPRVGLVLVCLKLSVMGWYVLMYLLHHALRVGLCPCVSYTMRQGLVWFLCVLQ